MRWNVDASLQSLLDGGGAHWAVSLVWAPQEVLPTRKVSTEWHCCLVFNREAGPKLREYGHTIRECYLRARKTIRKLSVEDRQLYGVRIKPRSGTYAKARKLGKK